MAYTLREANNAQTTEPEVVGNVFFSMRTAKKARRQVGLLRTLPIYLARTRTTGTALEHTLRPCPGRLRNMESRA